MSELLLAMDNATIQRQQKYLVKDIDLKLHRGEIVTLMGPNGSGKTTTAKLALGILKPDQGSVWRKPNIKIGYVPQKLAIDPSMPLTVERLMRLTAPITAKDIDLYLQEVGAAHLKKRQISALSGGELQRVLLARAVVRKPDILVLDEPLQGVDYNGEKELYAWISLSRKKLNCAILLISHDLHIVMAATDRVICLNGHICCSGTPETVAASEPYSALLKGQTLSFYQHHHKDKKKKNV